MGCGLIIETKFIMSNLRGSCVVFDFVFINVKEFRREKPLLSGY